MKKPQFKDLTFKSQKEFNEWLGKTADKQIILEDLAHDLTKIWVHESGEILHCNFHANIYNGKFINMDILDKFAPLQIDGEFFYGLIVEQIKDLKNETANVDN